MDVWLTLIIGSTLFMTANTVIFERKDSQYHHCCNGTLGYVANKPLMPCSSMKCCNKTETVVVFPVNHSYGYGFKCMPKDYIKTECYKTHVPVVSSNETEVTYEPRSCCDNHKFEVLYHNRFYNAALVIRCTHV